MPTTHLAILTDPWLDLILDGHKTIETRISKVKLPPYEAVAVGDHVLMKQSGGPIKGAFEIEQIETYHADSNLDKLVFDEVFRENARQIYGFQEVMYAHRDALEKKWCESKYATFIHVENVQRYDPDIPIKKTNRLAWVVLGDGTAAEWLDRLL
ncbi:MAG: ASCH domain-containing protein [Candidatus Poribacteria bacterium]|nr:ASCH domain-containing protein [Candidatus Poribacteria bacterium]